LAALVPVLSQQLKRRLQVFMLVLPVVLVALPQTGVQKRLGEAVHELVLLQAGDNSGASVVPRLYMWQLGMDLITQRPLLAGASPVKR
jgi:O-antigen ligase